MTISLVFSRVYITKRKENNKPLFNDNLIECEYQLLSSIHN